MSGRKKSALGVALDYSLHIGRAETDTVKTGVVEAGWSGKGQAESVQQIDADYKALAGKLRKVEQEFAGLSKTASGGLRGSVEALGTNAKELEKRAVSNDETERTEMLRLIKVQSDAADGVLKDIAKAKLPAPEIRAPGSLRVFVGEPVTLAKIGATTDPDGLSLSLLGPDGVAAAEVRAAEPGHTTVMVVSEATDEYRQGRRPVAIIASLRPRVITCPPPAPMPWGKALTTSDFDHKATGKGAAVELLTSTTDFEVGERDVVLEAKGDGKTWGDGRVTVKVTVERAKRFIRWKLPASVAVGEPVTAELLGVQVFWGEGRGAVESDDDVDVVLPAGGAFAKPGAKLDVKVQAPQTGTHQVAERGGTLTVVKGTPVLEWSAPPTAVAGDTLEGKHLAVTVEPKSLRKDLVFAPAKGSPLATGLVMLKVSFAGSEEYEAASCSVRLMVAANKELALGVDAAHDGSAFTAPTDAAGKARLKAWNDSDEDDPEALATLGKRLMAEVSQMTKAEILAFMTEHKDDANVSRFVNEHGKKILSFKNGLEIRYKPNGSLKSGGRPILCMEVRNDPAKDVSTGQGDIAFKVTATGQPAQKGPAGIKRPAGSGTWTTAQKDDFDDGVMAATHMAVRT